MVAFEQLAEIEHMVLVFVGSTRRRQHWEKHPLSLKEISLQPLVVSQPSLWQDVLPFAHFCSHCWPA